MPAPRPPTAAELGFGRLFAQVQDAVVVADARGRIVLWNPSAERLLGYTAAEAVGRDVSLLVPERFRERHDAGMRRFRESGHGPLVDSGAILELPARRKDGQELVVEMRLSKVDEGALYVMAILRDITDRVLLARQIDADRAQLRDANEALESFSYVVGHDLKEPVRAVEAYLEAGDVERARQANARLAQLLDGLLEWSRATVGGIDRVALRVDEVILSSACGTRYQRVLEDRGARLDVEGEFRPVMGTHALLCQAFGNLVLNAIRHNPKPAPRVTVLQAPGPEGFLLHVVRDDGPGFPAHVKARAAGAGSARERGSGGGFGLAIAKRAIESLGGRLELADAPAGGAEARVWLPAADE